MFISGIVNPQPSRYNLRYAGRVSLVRDLTELNAND
jgi:hypothetical protein